MIVLIKVTAKELYTYGILSFEFKLVVVIVVCMFSNKIIIKIK